MIVWSKGLGKQRLPLNLADAELKVEAGNLMLTGIIEPVCWNYAIRLLPEDIACFLKLASQPTTVRFLAQRGGLFFPLVFGLLARAPRLTASLFVRLVGLGQKGNSDAFLV